MKTIHKPLSIFGSHESIYALNLEERENVVINQYENRGFRELFDKNS